MRALIQRVSFAKVEIGEKTIAEIPQGLLVFLGVCEDDDLQDVEWLSSKMIQMRIFSDEKQKMNLSIQEIEGQIMIISQFTLFASTKKGNRPGFTSAARPEKAEELYLAFIKRAEELIGKKIKTGTFGADMQIHLANDGPVTIWIDSKNKE
ncbi:MAG: D-tyrosyl-tRNA(Tyr) deacylase [Saprospiraceae bacterium]|nr:D-tyrosyl-tRNA(Tyr) deacylase [Saprospiraceae bacterium]